LSVRVVVSSGSTAARRCSRWRAGRKVAERRPTELVLGDAAALPFGDAEFDACRADRTLQHLAEPVRALGEMVRVTRPSGRVVVTESRWGLVAPSLDAGVTDAILERSATRSEQAGWVGYRLPAMFEQAGLGDVQSISSDHTVCEHDDFFRFTHLAGSADAAGRAGALTRAEAARWVESLSDLLRRSEAFAMVIVLHVAGVRPAR
jgi:SAM-dependent methyltransferase